MQGTVTLLNKLKRKDSTTNTDIWYKTILTDCAYKKTSLASVTGKTVGMGQKFTILIPFTGKYLPYKDWKNLVDKTGFYTLSPSDVIILGTVEEDVTDKNIITIKNDYEPNSCEIMSIEQVDKKLSVKFEFRVGGV